MGEELSKVELKAGKPKVNSSPREPLPKPKLSDIGITKKQSSVYQQLAAIPEETFEAVIEAHNLAGGWV
jgi:hypothetical protein